MKLLLLALLCLAAFSSAQEFDIKNALIYDDPFVVGALWVNVIYDDFMPSITNPVRPAGSGVMALEYLNAADEVIMTEVTDFFFKYVFQYCDDCSATTVQQEMPIFYHDSTYYTQSIGEQVVNGVTCQGYENPAVVAGTPSLSRRIYIDEATDRPCRHEWSTGKKIDFLTSRQTVGDVTVYPDGSNSIDDESIAVLDGQTVLPASANFPWASGCPAPTCKVKIDLMMVLDDSGSVGSTGFTLQVNFFKSLVNSFTISPDDVRVGIVKFADTASLELSLSDNSNTVIDALDDIRREGGWTCIGCGMSFARSDIEANGRSDAQCVMVVLTDGRNNRDTGTFTNVVNAVHNQPCEVFGIGVGNTLEETLNSYVSDPIADHRFLVNDFGALATVLNSVATATCQEIPGSLCGAGCQGLCLCQTDCACPSSCEDFDACTTEECVAGSNGNGCVYRGRDCALEDQVASGLSSVNLCKIFDCDEDTGCVSVDVDCDDMDPCTVDTCDPSFGCARSPLICNDNNVCTVDFCDPTLYDANNPNADVCVYESADCTKCEDQVNGGLVNCSLERFNPNFADVSLCNPAVCNPDSPNEVYDTDPIVGKTEGDGPCEFRPVNCDDGNPCSVTECVDGVCTVGPLVCEDGNACTIDTCDPNTVGGVDPCVFTPINATIECFDGNPCTQDLCLPESGCDNSQETDCSSLSECAITSCVAALGGCVADTQRCAAESECFTAECVPENLGGNFDPLVHCVQTEIEGTINSCGECFGNEVACQLEGSKATTIALTVGVIAAIVVAVIVALALGAFGGHQGYKYWQKRNNGPPNWSENNPIHQTLPSGGNAAAV